MCSKWIVTALTLAVVAAAAGETRAQLFGDRSLRGPLAPRPRPGGTTVTAGSDNAGGGLRGNERFLRGNRQTGNFVGTDTRDRRGFVGLQQGETSGAFQSVQTGLRIEQAPDANRGQAKTAPPRARMYDPRLSVAFEFSRPSAGQRSSDLAQRLASCSAIHRRSLIEVLVEGETATLRGEVASERDRTLAGMLLLFEPGISKVQNELAVKPPDATPAENPPANRNRKPGPREF